MRILKLTLNQTLGLGLSSPDGILRLNLNQTLDFLNQTLNLGIFPEGNLKLTLNQIIDLAHLLPEGLLQYTSNQTTGKMEKPSKYSTRFHKILAICRRIGICWNSDCSKEHTS